MWLIFQKLAVGFFKVGIQKLKTKKWLLGFSCFFIAIFFLFFSFKRI